MNQYKNKVEKYICGVYMRDWFCKYLRDNKSRLFYTWQKYSTGRNRDDYRFVDMYDK